MTPASVAITVLNGIAQTTHFEVLQIRKGYDNTVMVNHTHQHTTVVFIAIVVFLWITAEYWMAFRGLFLIELYHILADGCGGSSMYAKEIILQ